MNTPNQRAKKLAEVYIEKYCKLNLKKPLGIPKNAAICTHDVLDFIFTKSVDTQKDFISNLNLCFKVKGVQGFQGFIRWVAAGMATNFDQSKCNIDDFAPDKQTV